MLYANNEMRAYLIDFAKNKTPVQKHDKKCCTEVMPYRLQSSLEHNLFTCNIRYNNSSLVL